MEDTNFMKDYIIKNIDSVNNTNYLIFFIKESGINYSENKNGIFINLSLLNEDIITELYKIIFTDINKVEITDKQIIENELFIEDNGVEIENKIEKKYKSLKLSPLQINLLKYSK